MKTQLINYGIETDRMIAVGYGDSKPIGDNSTAVGREQNRRTELKIIDKN